MENPLETTNNKPSRHIYVASWDPNQVMCRFGPSGLVRRPCYRGILDAEGRVSDAVDLASNARDKLAGVE